MRPGHQGPKFIVAIVLVAGCQGNGDTSGKGAGSEVIPFFAHFNMQADPNSLTLARVAGPLGEQTGTVKVSGETWSITFAKDGEILNAVSQVHSQLALVRKQPLHDALDVSRATRVCTEHARASLTEGELKATSAAPTGYPQLLQVRVAVSLHGYEVAHYGGTYEWRRDLGMLTKYSGSYRLPPAARPFRALELVDLLEPNERKRVTLSELKWFDFGKGRLVLAWRIQRGSQETFCDAGTGKVLKETPYWYTRPAPPVPGRAPSTR